MEELNAMSEYVIAYGHTASFIQNMIEWDEKYKTTSFRDLYDHYFGIFGERVSKDKMRYRNWQLVFYMERWQAYKSIYLTRIRTIGKFFRGQQEVSKFGFQHLQCYLNTKESYTLSAIRKKIGVFTIIPVASEDVPRAKAYCRKKQSRVEDGEEIEFGNADKRTKLGTVNCHLICFIKMQFSV